MNQEQYYNSAEKPIGVVILSVLHFIGGFAISIIGIIVLILGVESISQLNKISPLIDLPEAGGIIIVIGVFILIYGALNIWIGYGLIKLRNWARITVIVLSIISIIYNLFGLIFAAKLLSVTTIPFVTSAIMILFSLVIVIYLSSIIIRKSFLEELSSSNNYQDRYNENYINEKVNKPKSNYILKIIDGYSVGDTINLFQGSNVIGRSQNCEIQLDDPEKFVSGRHAEIYVNGNSAQIRNLSKVNKTFLNNRPIAKEIIKHNDQIKIARYTLKIIDAAHR